jgi:putative transposase
MSQVKFTKAQIMSILHAGRPVNELRQKYGISSATINKWKKQYGGLGASDMKRLKGLEQESTGIERMYDDPPPVNAGEQVIKKLISSNSTFESLIGYSRAVVVNNGYLFQVQQVLIIRP